MTLEDGVPPVPVGLLDPAAPDGSLLPAAPVVPALPLPPLVPAAPGPGAFPVPEPPVPVGMMPIDPLHPARNPTVATTAHAQTVLNLLWLRARCLPESPARARVRRDESNRGMPAYPR